MRTSTEIFAENLRNLLIERNKKQADLQRIIADLSKEPKQVEDVFIGNWKEVYQMLDAEHRRGFWRNLIEELVIDEDGKPVGIKFLY